MSALTAPEWKTVPSGVVDGATAHLTAVRRDARALRDAEVLSISATGELAISLGRRFISVGYATTHHAGWEDLRVRVPGQLSDLYIVTGLV